MAYQDEYQRWLQADLLDVDLKTELQNIKDDEDAIKERFAVALQFGTAGLRGTLGAGTNRMDGIRMDAVSNLIYWAGNRDRGTNQGSLDFVKRLNYYIQQNFPSVLMIAEDSSDYPKVTGSLLDGGLGFHYKWDLGWMNDTLKYYATDPLYRNYDHHKLTFSMAYYYSEHFLLPLSHGYLHRCGMVG